MIEEVIQKSVILWSTKNEELRSLAISMMTIHTKDELEKGFDLYIKDYDTIDQAFLCSSALSRKRKWEYEELMKERYGNRKDMADDTL